MAAVANCHLVRGESGFLTSDTRGVICPSVVPCVFATILANVSHGSPTGGKEYESRSSLSFL